MKFAAVLAALGTVSVALAQVAPGPNPKAKVATAYYYWYRWPLEHFKAGRKGVEGHFHHFVNEEKVDYLDPDWHRAEFEAMAKSGIDFVLPVYWGDFPRDTFSTKGLPPMVEALEQIEKAGARSVRVGLFLDTTLLQADVRRGEDKVDLRTNSGKAFFCRQVIGFFDRIPKRFWARVDGRALIVMYTSEFVSGWDRTLGPALRRAFAKKFDGERMFLVSDASWRAVGQDRTTSWGAALWEPKLYPGIAQIGPGFDDSPVPGRRTPSRDRENGNYYRWSWRRAIASRPELVVLETWNELHEGSEICETKELGRKYLDITREWVGRLRSGELGPEIPLRSAESKPWNDRRWGREAAGADSVFVDFTKPVPHRFGLREGRVAGAPYRIARRVLRPRMQRGRDPLIYFEVSDFFRFDIDENLQVLIDAEPIGGVPIELEYHSRDASAPEKGRYAVAKSRNGRGSGEAWRIIFELPRARFANRQMGSADFRIRIRGVRTAIRRVELRSVKKKL